MLAPKSLLGLLALSTFGSALPAVDSSIKGDIAARDSTCVGGSYYTCVEFYFDTICLTTCSDEDLIARQDCVDTCSTNEQSNCETYCS